MAEQTPYELYAAGRISAAELTLMERQRVQARDAASGKYVTTDQLVEAQVAMMELAESEMSTSNKARRKKGSASSLRSSKSRGSSSDGPSAGRGMAS